jgi:hypothetical protein
MFSKGEVFKMLTVHVDDQLIASNDRRALNAFKIRLHNRFECKDQGPVSYFLGIHVVKGRTKRRLSISKEHYLEQPLVKFAEAEFEEAKHLGYPQIVGSVM